jgi:hypothetical protein
VKKLAAILLLALFAFNTFGFYLFVSYAKRRADADLVAELDNGDYSESELVTVKIPLNLPYEANWNDFQRVNGEIDINGTIYNYVQRKVYNDTLILQCIVSIEKTSLQKKANDYYGKVNDLPGNNNNKKTEAFKQFFSYYDNHAFSYDFYNLDNNVFLRSPDGALLMHQYLPVNEQPPDFFQIVIAEDLRLAA